MRVLVGVHVNRLQPRPDDAFDLRLQLRVRLQPPPPDRPDHLPHSARQRVASDQRNAAHQHQMAANIQRRRLPSQHHCLIKRRAIRHNRRRRENALPVRGDDPRIHVARETEVIRIDHQRFH